MQFLPIEAIRPGQTLAAGVCTESGAMLLPSGYCLTDRSIERLRSAGVTQVPVLVPSLQIQEAEKRLEHLEARFKDVQNPVLLHLKFLVYQYFSRRKLEAEGSQP
jgi:hypothetical protein